MNTTFYPHDHAEATLWEKALDRHGTALLKGLQGASGIAFRLSRY